MRYRLGGDGEAFGMCMGVVDHFVESSCSSGECGV